MMYLHQTQEVFTLKREAVTSVRFTKADKEILKELVDKYNEADIHPKMTKTSMLRRLIREEHERLFNN